MDGHFGEPDSVHQGGDGMDHHGTQEKVDQVYRITVDLDNES